ncbi:FHA domain-containing protein [Halomonas sp. A29]|uniref:SctD/MshK family protein n=1 Tax=Halomonas sp. A29 TaxID=3102786 RepID=UPI00398B374A
MASVTSYLLPTTEVFSTLEVRSGLHAGVAVPLEQPVCRIGSATSCDVMLSDADLASEHVILRFHARMVAIEAVGGTVEANGKPLAQGTGWRTSLPVTLAIGEVRLTLTRPELALPPALQSAQQGAYKLQRRVRASAPVAWAALKHRLAPMRACLRRIALPIVTALQARMGRLWSRLERVTAPVSQRLGRWLAPLGNTIARQWQRAPIPLRWRQRLVQVRQASPDVLARPSAAVTALCTTLAIVAIYQFVGVGKAGASISASALYSTGMLHPQAAEAARSLIAADIPPGEALAQRLAEAGLNALQVRDSGSHLVVAGEFPPERYDEWRDVQHWFDQHYGGSQLLISEARPGLSPDAPAFQFQAVWFGENPYVVGPRGERLYPGAGLQEGWVLAEIADNRVTVRRGSDEFSLTL